ncbi:MAG: glutaredoxin [Deltaproteobacteria bacterium]|nr:glutaredoxin [Deltaproteobacteria bacterium]
MNKVIIYTMVGCPYCEKAKALMTRRDVAFEEKLVEENNDVEWDRLYKLSGMKTMPQIFFGDKLIGGYSELEVLDTNDKLNLLKHL